MKHNKVPSSKRLTAIVIIATSTPSPSTKLLGTGTLNPKALKGLGLLCGAVSFREHTRVYRDL